MNAMTPYLNFDGKTGEAMKFYQACLGGELNIQTFKDAHMDQGDPRLADRVVHAVLRNGKATLMASDTQPGHPFQQGNNLWVNVDCSVNELDEFYRKLIEGGKVHMEPQDTFWGARFGMLTDRFGVNWMFNSEKPKS